jgi:hypothetical protein
MITLPALTAGGSIAINSPSSNNPVSVTFSASGSISNTSLTNVAGSITVGSTPYPGTVITQGPNWQISFSQPASAEDALLQVWCTDDTSIMAQMTINIGSSGGGSGGTGGGGGRIQHD